VGGVHGNEPFGPALVRSLHKSPIEGVDSVIANERAVEANVRFIDNELSVKANPNGTSYEDRCLAALIERGKDYPLVLDFHNGHSPATHEAWLGALSHDLKKPARWLLAKTAIPYVIQFNPNWVLYRSLPQTIAIEQGLPAHNYPDWESQQIEHWRATLQEIGKIGLNSLQPPEASGVEPVYLELTTEITRETAKQCRLEQFASLRCYDRLPTEAAESLGLTPGSYRVLCWGYRNMSKLIEGTEGERAYWGQVAKEVEPLV
jgi:hypothetical protein